MLSHDVYLVHMSIDNIDEYRKKYAFYMSPFGCECTMSILEYKYTTGSTKKVLARGTVGRSTPFFPNPGTVLVLERNH